MLTPFLPVLRLLSDVEFDAGFMMSVQELS